MFGNMRYLNFARNCDPRRNKLLIVAILTINVATFLILYSSFFNSKYSKASDHKLANLFDNGVKLITLGGEESDDANNLEWKQFWNINGWDFIPNGDLLESTISKITSWSIPRSRRQFGFWLLSPTSSLKLKSDDELNDLHNKPRHGSLRKRGRNKRSLASNDANLTTIRPDMATLTSIPETTVKVTSSKCLDCMFLTNFQNNDTSLWIGIEISLHLHSQAALFLSFKYDWGSSVIPIVKNPYDKNIQGDEVSFCTEIVQNIRQDEGGVHNVMISGRLYNSDAFIIVDKITVALGPKESVQKYMRSLAEVKVDTVCKKS